MTISSNFPWHFKEVFHKDIVTTTIMLCVNRTLDDEEVESFQYKKNIETCSSEADVCAKFRWKWAGDNNFLICITVS